MATVATATCVVVGAPIVALVARSFDVGNGWSLTAWSKLGTDDARPGLGLGIDPLASIAVSLRFAVVAALVATVIGFLAATAITTSPRLGQAARRRTDAAARQHPPSPSASAC